MTDLPDLSPFELRDVDHTDLFGIFLAVHALPGALLLLHTTVGCKFKTQLHLVHHDWVRESHNQRLWTGVDDVELIRGSGERLAGFARTWYDRRRPALFLVATSTAIELSALDVEAAVEALRAELPCPVLLLRAPGYDGSLWRGYRRVVEAVAGLLDWDRPADPAAIAFVGYLRDRFEAEHDANLAGLRDLAATAGGRVSGVLFGGEPFDSVREAATAGVLAVLPYAHPLAPGLRVRTGRTVVEVDLPIGVAGTTAFVERLAGALGRDTGDLAARTGGTRARLAPIARRLQGTRAAVFLDTPMAAAVVAFLAELGVAVPLVALTDGEEGDEARFEAAVARTGVRLPAVPRVLVDRPRDEELDALQAARADGPIGLVVGSAVQQAALRAEGTPVVEMGYPSTTRHFLHPVPWMGFDGAVALAGRFLDAASHDLAY